MTQRENLKKQLRETTKDLKKLGLKETLKAMAWVMLGSFAFSKAAGRIYNIGEADMGVVALESFEQNILGDLTFDDEKKTKTDKGDGA